MTQPIITCYSNDFKYENWYLDQLINMAEKTIVILISSSGKSKI